MRIKGTIQMDPPLIIEYTTIPSPNIYYTDDHSHVANNNYFLELDLHEFDNMPNGIDIQRYRTYFVYTSKTDWKYTQYIFLKSADKKFIKHFADTLPPKASAILYDIAEL